MAQLVPGGAPLAVTSSVGSGEVAIVRLDRIGKAFRGGGRELVVFDDLSLEVEVGSFVSIVGPSGCGKSTLLKLISGLERPDAGTVAFRGSEISAPPRGMIYVFQQYTKSIFPWRTVIENVEFGLSTHKRLGKREAREVCRETIRLVGLEGYDDYFPYQLSGGMQQRVCIARALVCEPAVLLMDEPFSAVDAMTRALMQELLLDLWQRLSITVLFVTHDVDEAVFLSSRILALGRVPSGIVEDIAIDLPRPREAIATRADPRFTAYRQRLFAGIFTAEKSALTHG